MLPSVLRDLKGTHQRYVSRLASNLKDLRFRALDKTLEAKELLREAHDRKRASHAASIHLQKVTKGSLVCVHHPTAGLRKLRFQWSNPTYLVIETRLNTCTVIDLVSKEGRNGGYPPTVRINRKSMVPYPTTAAFFTGRVLPPGRRLMLPPQNAPLQGGCQVRMFLYMQFLLR